MGERNHKIMKGKEEDEECRYKGLRTIIRKRKRRHVFEKEKERGRRNKWKEGDWTYESEKEDYLRGEERNYEGNRRTFK